VLSGVCKHEKVCKGKSRPEAVDAPEAEGRGSFSEPAIRVRGKGVSACCVCDMHAQENPADERRPGKRVDPFAAEAAELTQSAPVPPRACGREHQSRACCQMGIAPCGKCGRQFAADRKWG
jgi:hypothetical protein